MSEHGQRMADGSTQPNAESVAQWLGAGEYRHWVRLLEFIEAQAETCVVAPAGSLGR